MSGGGGGVTHACAHRGCIQLQHSRAVCVSGPSIWPGGGSMGRGLQSQSLSGVLYVCVCVGGGTYGGTEWG